MKINSEVIMEEKESGYKLLQKEAKEIFVSRKNRQAVLNQYINKIRWRFDNLKNIESNAKLVGWEDGSYGIFVGDKYREISNHNYPSNKTLYTVEVI